MKNKLLLCIKMIIPMLIIVLVSCSKDSEPLSSGETTKPVINNLVAEKTEILYGGQDPAIITCVAEGGNLEYLWEVDLGDIFPMNDNFSKIRFTGSSCCVGEKIIKCTVTNDKGSDSKEIKINILPELKFPEIFSIETDKNQISFSKETAKISCYAIGGNLKYTWESACGEIEPLNEEKWEVKYTANASCLGEQTIKCTVSNSLGSISKTINISVIL